MEISAETGRYVDPQAFRSLRGEITFLGITRGLLTEIPFTALSNAQFACQNGVGPILNFEGNQISNIPANQFAMLMEKIGCPFRHIYFGMKNVENCTICRKYPKKTFLFRTKFSKKSFEIGLQKEKWKNIA